MHQRRLRYSNHTKQRSSHARQAVNRGLSSTPREPHASAWGYLDGSGLSPGNRHDPLHHCRGSVSMLENTAGARSRRQRNPDSHGGDMLTNSQIQSTIAT